MNWLGKQIKSLFGFFKYVILDLITDIQFVFKVIKKMVKREELEFDPVKVAELKKELKSITIGSLLKENWYWLLVAVFCIAVGFMLGIKYGEVMCNNYIVHTFYNNTFLDDPNLWNFTLNTT